MAASKAGSRRGKLVQKWCLTLNNYTEVEIAELKKLSTQCTFAIIGKETGDKGTRHLQGYFNFGRTNRKYMNALKKCSPRAHWEAACGSDKENETFCSKDGDILLTHGAVQDQGMRNDLSKAVSLLNDGKSLTEVAHSCPETFIRYGRGLRDYINTTRLVKGRDFKTELFVYVGPPGCGKTRLAFELGPENTYFKASGEWWDGYTGQRRVVIDDFYGWIEYEELLHLCDRYPMKVPIRGAYVEFISKEIFITSTVHVQNWYKFEGYDPRALCRRMTQYKAYDATTKSFIDTSPQMKPEKL